MEHIIFANPVSGRKNGKKKAIIVQKLLRKNNIKSKIFLSEYPRHLTYVSRKLAKKKKCRFYVIGGDGTLNEVVSGIIGTDSEIVVIPGGTGNDFVKTVSKYMSLRKIVLNSINKESTKTDCISVGNDMYCINILNAGFDAMVGKNVDNFRIFNFLSGKMKYNLSIFYTLLNNRNYKFKIRDDINGIFKGHYTLIAVANGKYYGGGICPCPNADVHDGKLDICLVDSTTIGQKIVLLPKYKKGNHLNHKKAHIFKAKKLHIVSTHPFPVSIDGEIFYTNKLSIKVLKDAVNIVHID